MTNPSQASAPHPYNCDCTSCVVWRKCPTCGSPSPFEYGGKCIRNPDRWHMHRAVGEYLHEREARERAESELREAREALKKFGGRA